MTDSSSLRIDPYERMQRAATFIPMLKPRASLGLPPIDEYRLLRGQAKEKLVDLRLHALGSALIVNTPQVRDANLLLSHAMLTNVGRTHGFRSMVLSGKAHTGKTTALLAVAREQMKKHTKRYPDWEESAAVPIAYVSVPPGSYGKALAGRIASYFDLPEVGASLEEVTQTIIHAMIEKRTKLVLIDEMHKIGSGTSGQVTSDVLKDIADHVPATFVYAGINIENLGVIASDRGDQLGGRSSIVRIEPYNRANNEERAMWNSVLVSFERAFHLYGQKDTDILQHGAYLWDVTQGSMGDLGDLLTLAAKLAISEADDPKDEALTLALLETISPSIAAQRHRLDSPESSAIKRPPLASKKKRVNVAA
jgi:Bacterial TniB protein